MARVRSLEARRQEREFARLIAAGESPTVAARLAGIGALRALRLLSDPAFWQVFVASRSVAA